VAAPPPPFFSEEEEEPPPSPSNAPPAVVLVPTDFDEADLFPPPAPQPVGEEVVEEVVEPEMSLKMRTVEGGTEAQSDYSESKGEVEDPKDMKDENTKTQADAESDLVPNNPDGTGIN